jgi:hypothetical protein
MTSENVAPVVAYLASEESDWCTGQVIGASGLSVSLFNRPSVIAEFQAASEEAYVDDTFGSLEAAFRTAVEGTENFYEVVAKNDLAARQRAAD